MARRLPEEAIGVRAETLLAEDELRRGEGARALERYRRICALPIDRSRLPAPLDTAAAGVEARGRLARWCEIHDPASPRAGEPPDLWAGGSPYAPVGVCGNYAQEAAQAAALRAADRAEARGDSAEALRQTWEALVRDDAAASDPAPALAWAERCGRLGTPAEFAAGLRRLRGLAEEAGDRYPRDARMAKLRFLEEYRDLQADIAGRGFAAVEEAVADLLRKGIRVAEGGAPADASLLRLIHLARVREEVRRAASARCTGPGSPASLVYAAIAGAPVGIEHALDVLSARWERGYRTDGSEAVDPGGLDLGELAGAVLAFDETAACERMIARMERDGVGVWEAWRRAAWRFSLGGRWRVAQACAAHRDPAIRDWAAVVRRNLWECDPWECFCAEGR